MDDDSYTHKSTFTFFGLDVCKACNQCEGHSSQAVTLNWRSVWGRDGVLRMRGAEGGKWEAEMLRTLAPRLLDLGLRGGSDLS